jgi:hypothetical protein
MIFFAILNFKLSYTKYSLCVLAVTVLFCLPAVLVVVFHARRCTLGPGSVPLVEAEGRWAGVGGIANSVARFIATGIRSD